MKPPARAGRGRWMLLVGLVGLAVLLVVVGVLYLDVTQGKVMVSTIQLTSPADVCGLNGQSLQGFTSDEGASVLESLTVHNANLSSGCTVHSVTATTAGFSVTNANTPLTIAAGASATLAFTIDVPHAAFSGSLALDVN